MVRLALLILAAVCCQAQSLQTVAIGGTAGTFTSSGSALLDFTVELRINNIAASKSYLSNGGGTGNINCATDGSTPLNITCLLGAESAPSGAATVTATVGQDVRIRYTHNGTAQSNTIEIWQGNCSGYASSTKPSTPNTRSLPMSSASFVVGPNVSVAFLRIHSALITTAACPVDAPVATTEVLAFPFENGSGGTLVASVGGYTMSAAGSSFSASTTYNPIATITGYSTYKAVGRTFTAFSLSGATSVSFLYPGTGIVASYFWQQLAGPATCSFSSRTSATPTVTCPLAGQYTIQLTVADSAGTTATATLSLGQVATDSNNISILPNAEFTWVVGNFPLYGSSVWPWYEVTEAADADALSPLMLAPPTVVAGAGTVTINSGGPNQLVDGYITASTYGSVAIDCTGCNFVVGDAAHFITINWDVNGDATNAGKLTVYVNSYISATRVLAANYQIYVPAASLAGSLTWGRTNADYAPYYGSDGGSFILNFYEAGLAVGRLAERTGLTTYRTQFHTFCNNWWKWSLGSGYMPPIPRNSGFHLMLACAADPTYTDPGYTVTNGIWDGVARLTILMAPASIYVRGVSSDLGYNPTHDAAKGLNDAREMSYVLRPTSILAKYYGSHGGSSVTWCGYLQNQINHIWIAGSDTPTGAGATVKVLTEDLYYLASGYVAAGDPPITGPFGASPWRTIGLSAIALSYAREAADSCGLTAERDALYKSSDQTGLIVYLSNFIWLYGRAPDGGLMYSEGYASQYGDFESPPVAGAGTISVTNASTAVVGSGTNFTTLYSPCDGTTYIGILGTALANRYVARVTACADATHLTINTGWPGVTEGSLTYSKAAQSSTNCGPFSAAGFCNQDPYNGRNLSADILAVFGWLYRQSTNATHLTRLNYLGNKLFGGASGGAGSTGTATGSAVYSRSGTISVTNASTAVVGVGTAFLSQFTCNGTDSITIADNTTGYTFAAPPGANPVFYTRTVASCADNTHLTLSTVYPGTTAGTIAMFYNSTDSQWPGADGGVGNLGEILPVCSSNAPPCGLGYLTSKYGKPLGMAAGAGNAQVAMADRLGGVAPVSAQALLITGACPVALVVGVCPTANKIRCTITLPSGSVTVTTSTSQVFQCSVSPDTRMLGAWIQIAYLNSSNAVIANGDPYRYVF